MADTTKKDTQPAAPVATFKKTDIIESEKYKQYADIMQTELDEGKTYTDNDIKAVIDRALSHVVEEEVNP